MKKLLTRPVAAALLIIALSVPAGDAAAQCAMCRATAESNLRQKTNNIGAGLNKGILYLMSIPYVIGGVGAFVWFRKKKEIKDFFNAKPE
jgi:hypothetical protein